MKKLIYLALALLTATSCKKEEERRITMVVTGDRTHIQVSGSATYDLQAFTRWQQDVMLKAGDYITIRACRVAEDTTWVGDPPVPLPEYDMDVPLAITIYVEGQRAGEEGISSFGSPVIPGCATLAYQVP